ncbi:hypothetical protein G9F32_09655 [Acinetobacter sp. 194]|uniref:hypothetical protein n=1 Tax=Acinetobacter shaoyimingii TaxID=2715164 RepID=UPI00140E3310|nr:hypothetical protein [Acinetobacter shaoyimingii]NHB58283.1 hypothetical protein [Acinetobacter shaoyimingii]
MSVCNIKIEFYDDIDGFSLADLTIKIDETVFSTKQNVKYRLMIFIVLTDLLDGLTKLLKNEKKEYQLLSISSSFYLKITKKDDYIILTDNINEKKVPVNLFLKSLNVEVSQLYNLVKDKEDAAIEDFIEAYSGFKYF